MVTCSSQTGNKWWNRYSNPGLSESPNQPHWNLELYCPIQKSERKLEESGTQKPRWKRMSRLNVQWEAPNLDGASLVAQTIKNLPIMQGTWVQSLGQEDPLEKKMATQHQYSCLGNPMDRVGYSQWGHKELDMTEQLTFNKAGQNSSSSRPCPTQRQLMPVWKGLKEKHPGSW